MVRNDEIERRWIVTGFWGGDPSTPLRGFPSVRLRQGYLNVPGQLRVRIYDNPTGNSVAEPKAEITRKTGKGIHRVEENHRVSIPAAEMLLETADYKIDKTRLFRDGWEIDFFHGRLEGLILAEKELESVDEKCPIPQWLDVGPEVTETLNNKQLAMMAHYLDDPIAALMRGSSNIPRIVLTGGPCAGKSTLVEELKATEEFHCVPELATVIIGQFGIMPDGSDMFQRTLYCIQRAIEEGAARQAVKNGKRALILDRGTLDSAGFVPGGWREFEEMVGTSRAVEYSNYDAVMFLPVPSREIYNANRHNNPVRRETWEEARRADEQLHDAWREHPDFYYLEMPPADRAAFIRRKMGCE